MCSWHTLWERKKGKLQWSLGKHTLSQHAQLSPCSYIPFLPGICFPGEGSWLMKPCGRTPGISVYIEDVMGAPRLHMVTFFKGSIAFSGSYGNNNHLNTEESKQFKGTATGNGTYYHRGACWHCRCSLEEDRSQYWYRWMNCGKRTIAPSPHPSSQSSCLLLQWSGTWHAWQPGTQLWKKTKFKHYLFPYDLISTAQCVPVVQNYQMRPLPWQVWQIWC